MSKVLSALVGASMLGLVGVANAAEPVSLTNEQMDGVVAGILDIQVLNTALNAQFSLIRNNNAQNINDSLVNQN